MYKTKVNSRKFVAREFGRLGFNGPAKPDGKQFQRINGMSRNVLVLLEKRGVLEGGMVLFSGGLSLPPIFALCLCARLVSISVKVESYG